jgi:hypothetical protein
MTDEERERRILEKVAEERSGELRWWWLSFIDPGRAENDRFLGVAIVEASGPITATLQAHDLGINPGGEVAILPLPYPPKPEDRDRLLSREEAQVLQQRWAQ